MNNRPTDANVVSEKQLDLLVDGQLTGSDFRNVVQDIDSADDWKRCATWFLENQALQRELTQLNHEYLNPRAGIEVGTTAAIDRRVARNGGGAAWNRSLKFASLAASLMFVFATGIYVSELYLQFDQPARVLADSSKGTASAIKGNEIAAKSNADGDSKQLVETPVASQIMYASLFVAGQDGQDGQTVRVPLRSSNDNKSDQLKKMMASGLPSPIEEELNGLPVRYQHERKMLPCRTTDGKFLMIPIDRLKFVDNQLASFQ